MLQVLNIQCTAGEHKLIPWDTLDTRCHQYAQDTQHAYVGAHSSNIYTHTIWNREGNVQQQQPILLKAVKHDFVKLRIFLFIYL